MAYAMGIFLRLDGRDVSVYLLACGFPHSKGQSEFPKSIKNAHPVKGARF